MTNFPGERDGKFDPNQKRVPAGNGRRSGTWVATPRVTLADIRTLARNAPPELRSRLRSLNRQLSSTAVGLDGQDIKAIYQAMDALDDLAKIERDPEALDRIERAIVALEEYAGTNWSFGDNSDLENFPTVAELGWNSFDPVESDPVR